MPSLMPRIMTVKKEVRDILFKEKYFKKFTCLHVFVINALLIVWFFFKILAFKADFVIYLSVGAAINCFYFYLS